MLLLKRFCNKVVATVARRRRAPVASWMLLGAPGGTPGRSCGRYWSPLGATGGAPRRHRALLGAAERYWAPPSAPGRSWGAGDSAPSHAGAARCPPTEDGRSRREDGRPRRRRHPPSHRAGAAGDRTLTGRQPACLALVCPAHPAAQRLSAGAQERSGRPPRRSAGGLHPFLCGEPFWDPDGTPLQTPRRHFFASCQLDGLRFFASSS